MNLKQYLDINPEVKAALDAGKPVVALESTIISHGMPYPQNVETARAVEAIIREEGAVPATIAILGGKMKVGLSDDELELLGQEGQKAFKTSHRDIAYMLASKHDGATTVAATSYIASLAGIKVFCTGGIGGVHRGVEKTMDVSSDLTELENTPVAVVCAGCKAILDMAKTMEVLETNSVEVIGYQTDKLPAFYYSKSDYNVNHRLDTPEQIAELLAVKWAIDPKGGVLITNPVPVAQELDKDVMNKAIKEAIEEMDSLGITGNKTTPFLLAKVAALTGGDSLASNIALVKNNAHLASKIAIDLAKLK